MHTSFYFLLHFVLVYYYIIEQRFWGAYIVLASAIVQSSLNKYVYTKMFFIYNLLQITYQLLIMKYCEEGDLEGARLDLFF